MFFHTHALCTHVTLVGDEWEDEYASFVPKFFEVHPTNSQSVPLPMMGFEYVNGLLPIHKGPLRPLVGIMAHLVVSDLLICPFSFKELTHTYMNLKPKHVGLANCACVCVLCLNCLLG